MEMFAIEQELTDRDAAQWEMHGKYLAVKLRDALAAQGLTPSAAPEAPPAAQVLFLGGVIRIVCAFLPMGIPSNPTPHYRLQASTLVQQRHDDDAATR